MEPTAPDETQIPPSNEGNIPAGCGLAFLCQIGAGILSLFSLALDGNNKLGVILLCSWGLTQWIGIIPLIFRFKAEGKKQTIVGLVIMGSLGLLLSSACASTFYNFNVH